MSGCQYICQNSHCLILIKCQYSHFLILINSQYAHFLIPINCQYAQCVHCTFSNEFSSTTFVPSLQHLKIKANQDFRGTLCSLQEKSCKTVWVLNPLTHRQAVTLYIREPQEPNLSEDCDSPTLSGISGGPKNLWWAKKCTVVATHLGVGSKESKDTKLCLVQVNATNVNMTPLLLMI